MLFRSSPRGVPNLKGLNGTFVSQLMAQDNADILPTPAMRAAYVATCAELASVIAKWDAVLSIAVPNLNTALARDGATAIAVPARTSRTSCVSR